MTKGIWVLAFDIWVRNKIDHKIFGNCILNFHVIPQEGTPIQNRTLKKFLTMISFLLFKAETITRKLNHIVRVSATCVGIVSTHILLF